MLEKESIVYVRSTVSAKNEEQFKAAVNGNLFGEIPIRKQH